MVLAPAFAQSPSASLADSTINNTAEVTFITDQEAKSLKSNTVVTRIGRLVDVTNTAKTVKSDTIQPDTTGYAYTFLVTNTGNGADRFDLAAAFTSATAPVVGMWIDYDGNGLLDPFVDIRLAAADQVVVLAAGESVRILVTAKVGAEMSLTATSLDSDRDAVVRHRVATALQSPSRIDNDLTPSLDKSQSIDTRGAAAPGMGSIITYSLTSRIPAALRASNVRIQDSVPAGTTYIPGSLALDDAAISDAADSDAGAFDSLSGSLSVALPDTATATGTTVHTVRFQVRIN